MYKWIQMKTFTFEKEEDIHENLAQNKITKLENSFEITFKDVKKSYKKMKKNSDMFFFEAQIVKLELLNNSPFTLGRNKRINNCNICFSNVKNEKGVYFSGLVDKLCKNDRILITNGVLLKNNFTINSNKLTVVVRPENQSSVFLFKFDGLIQKSNLEIEKNLSKLIQPGIYSLFGNISCIIKYTDKDLQLLRIKSYDKSCVKTFKYPHSVQEFHTIFKDKINFVTKYDYYSNEVDILVKNPSTDFISLQLNQRICLNNVKMKSLNDSNIFLLKVNGDKINLKADPIETNSVNSLRPPAKHFPIPNELKPITQCSKKKRISPFKKLPLSFKQRKRTVLDSTSDDDIIDLTPCKNSTSNQDCNKNKSINTGASTSSIENTVIDNCSTELNINLSPCKDLTSNQVFNKDSCINKYDSTPHKDITTNVNNNNDNCSPVNTNQENGCKKSSPINHQNNDSLELSSDGSSSPLFFENQVPLFDQKQQLDTLHSSNTIPTKSTQCLGPCRLLLTEPNVFSVDDFCNNIVNGYCINNCFSFYPKSVLKKCPNVEKYSCPKCCDVVHLTLFFKMNFIYGKNENKAIEVCCYNENAQRVINKLTNKKRKLEDYLSNDKERKLIADTFKMLINNKVKMNIVVSDSLDDKTKILQTVDTKYVVTSIY